MSAEALPISDHALADLEVGQFAHYRTTLDAEAVRAFAGVTGDLSPIHVDPAYASGASFGGNLVHGMLIAGHFSAIVGMLLPGRSALLLEMNVQFPNPVPVGSEVVVSGRVASIQPSQGTIRLALLAYLDGRICTSGTALVQVRGGAATGERP